MTVDKFPAVNQEELFERDIEFHTPYFTVGSDQSPQISFIFYFNPKIDDKHLAGLLMIPYLPSAPFEGHVCITLFHQSSIHQRTNKNLTVTKTFRLYDSTYYSVQNIFPISSFYADSEYVKEKSFKLALAFVTNDSESIEYQWNLDNRNLAQHD